MKINTTVIASILLVTLIAGCAYGDRNLGMSTGTGAEAENAGVFERFIDLVGDTDTLSPELNKLLDENTEAINTTYSWEDDEYGPMHYAAAAGNLELVKALLARGAEVDITTVKNKKTPLLMAIFYGNVAVVNELVNNGANIRAIDIWNAGALHYAARSGQLEVFKRVEVIINQGGNYTPWQDKDGFNLLHLVALSSNKEQGEEALEQSTALAKYILEKYGNELMKEENPDRTIPLDIAASHGNEPMVELFIEKGVKKLLEAGQIRSAARMAYKGGHHEIAELISAAG